ncbi:thioredoxin domain containing protein [Chondrus crispus]|uniref:Thioredoxin domain containing protein n=1 Tax=Chondrus crispus TaxID=2769 RepID=R7QFI8_CHOCR|nr:thioredoxin domain containing protein [Chondrus crispus]CDF37297.1 thioredoxin domain containing protein [Chondrus crispus]|eukprot:XP_005717116.1 thioredoxin domain containing protein [Chondrus crispus]
MSLEHVSSLSAFQTILNTSGKKLVVVDFHATWCGPCHAIAPFYEKLSRKYAGRARFIKVDVDEAQDVAQHCSVSAMPTFHMYMKGNRVSDFSGADSSKLAAEVERCAPSSSDVSFGGSGRTLSDPAGASASGSGSKPSGSARSARAIAADAAARRMEEVAKAKAAARAAEEAAAKEAAAAAEKSDGKPSASSDGPRPAKNDARLKVDPVLLKSMVGEMGFPKIRAEKALILTGNKSIERAVEWCFQHADDADIDEPLQLVTKEGGSKPKLSPEEAKKKADELYARARTRREAEEKKEAIEKEKRRLKSGKEVTAAKLKLEEESRKRAVDEKKREKLEAKQQRERVRQMLEADKQRRREKFNMPGPAPSNPQPSKPKVAPPVAPRATADRGSIQFRLPDGSRIQGEFERHHTVGDLLSFLASTRPDIGSRNVTLSQQYPRRKFTSRDSAASLGDLNLLPREALTVLFS